MAFGATSKGEDMITVEMVLEKGFEFIAQDVINVSYPENEPDYQVIENRYLVYVNEKNPPWHDCDVKEFAWRNNKGEMPCDGELWVEIEFYDSLIRQLEAHKACDIDWEEDLQMKWRPLFKNWESEMNLDKIETQEEKEAFQGMTNSSEIPNVSEWKNGDECIYMSHNVVQQFVGPCPKREGYGYIQAPTFEINFVELSKLSKPETPEQKAEREREEWAQNVIVELMDSTGLDFTNDGDIQVVKAMYDLNYRKQNG